MSVILKCIFILFVWYLFIQNVIIKYNKLISRESDISYLASITTEASIHMKSTPVPIDEIISDGKSKISQMIIKELKGESYVCDTDTKEYIRSFVACFSYPDIHSVKNSLSLLKVKLDITLKNIFRKKEDIIKTKMVINGLLSLGATILII